MKLVDRYLSRRFLGWLAIVTFGLGALATMVKLTELILDLPNASFWELIAISMLSTPKLLYKVLPLIVILATAGLFVSLSRSSELTIVRGSGLSWIGALKGPFITSVFLSLIALAFGNPFVASSSRAYDQWKGQLSGEEHNVISAGISGIWLREGGNMGQTVTHAAQVDLDGTVLRQVSFFISDTKGMMVQRIDARQATLTTGGWELAQAKSWPLEQSNPEAHSKLLSQMVLPTTLTPDEIRDNFGDPSAISIWELPAFIDRLNTAGFSALRHQTWLHSEIARPLFLVSMMMIGAGFTAGHFRNQRTGFLVLGAVIAAFSLYFVRRFAIILGENGQLPVVIAAYTPSVVAFLFAVGLLLNREDI